MKDINTDDPDLEEAKKIGYWISNSKSGNSWAILSILSDNSDNITFLDENYRIMTRIAGAKTELYVRPSTKNNEFDGSHEASFKTEIGRAHV